MKNDIENGNVEKSQEVCMGVTFNSTLNDSDHRAFRRHVLFRYRKIHWLYGGILAILLLQTWFGGKPEETLTVKIFYLIGVLITFGGFVLLFYLVLWVIGRLTGTRFRGTLGQHVFEISSDSITESNHNGKIETRLSAVRRIDETPLHFFVITTTGMCIIIPKRDVPNCDMLRSLRMRIGRAKPSAESNDGIAMSDGQQGGTNGSPK